MSRFKILVIDDEEDALENYSRLIRKIGYDCATENDSVRAAENLASISPDIILTDLRMPVKSGFDILSAAREVDQDIPVILITAHASIPNAVEAVKNDLGCQ
jgi:DNA-binding NtrC family response regulator